MYLDSAVIVKLVVREPDSFYYADVVEGETGLISSELALTEVSSALFRKEREGELEPSLRRGAWEKFTAYLDTDMLRLAPVSRELLERANSMIERCHPVVPIRSLDAIHLATAESAARWPLVTNDVRMRAGAEHLRMPLVPLPPEDQSQS